MINKKLRKYIEQLAKNEAFDEESDYHANVLFEVDQKSFSSKLKDRLPSNKNINIIYNEVASTLLEFDKDSSSYLSSLPFLDVAEINPSLLEDNPYYQKLIKKSSSKYKDIEFGFDYFYPYVPFLLDEKIMGDDYKCHSPFGYFSKRIKYPLIRKNGANWMELVPHEINSMEIDINKAKGNILVVGLGLGYFAYMTSNKKEVSSVNILEKDKDIIEIFNSCLLDEFENKSKIKIINDDALTYLDYPKYDFVYIDIYRDEADGLPLVGKLLNNPKLPLDTSFWFISSLIVYLRRFVIVSLEMASNPSFNEKEYGEFGRDLKDPTNVDYLIYKIYKDYIKPNNINTKENIDSLLSFESMLGLLKDLFK